MKNLEARFDEGQVAELRGLLGALKPKDVEAVEQAMEALLQAADSYKSSHSRVESNGRKTRPNIAESRAAMAKLVKHLNDAQSARSVLPASALEALANAADAPIGQQARGLDVFALSARSALKSLQDQPNKQVDDDISVCALAVALVFREILRLKPAATRDKSLNVTGMRGGAAYARVLRQTLVLVGRRNVDIGPVIDRGLALLKDPELPHNLP